MDDRALGLVRRTVWRWRAQNWVDSAPQFVGVASAHVDRVARSEAAHVNAPVMEVGVHVRATSAGATDQHSVVRHEPMTRVSGRDFRQRRRDTWQVTRWHVLATQRRYVRVFLEQRDD